MYTIQIPFIKPTVGIPIKDIDWLVAAMKSSSNKVGGGKKKEKEKEKEEENDGDVEMAPTADVNGMRV